MNIVDLLVPERIVCNAAVTSKKRALELLSDMMADVDPDLGEMEIYNGLLARERLGSTGLGHGVAIPHGRFKNVTDACGVLVRLETGVDFDAIDGKPVDLLFALLVPEESTEEHLQLLAALAEMFADEGMRARLRGCDDAQAVLTALEQWTSSGGGTA